MRFSLSGDRLVDDTLPRRFAWRPSASGDAGLASVPLGDEQIDDGTDDGLDCVGVVAGDAGDDDAQGSAPPVDLPGLCCGDDDVVVVVVDAAGIGGGRGSWKGSSGERMLKKSS